jgi:hypothetical protein
LRGRLEFGDSGSVVTDTVRPYPSAGGCYELELYLAVDKCEGLARGLYHYDAGGHALVPIGVRRNELEALLIAPSHMPSFQKDVGVLIQTLYMMATDMGLGGCAIGSPTSICSRK